MNFDEKYCCSLIGKRILFAYPHQTGYLAFDNAGNKKDLSIKDSRVHWGIVLGLDLGRKMLIIDINDDYQILINQKDILMEC